MKKIVTSGVFEPYRPHSSERRLISKLRAALKPFAHYYEINDCHDRPNDNLEVPIADLKRARDALARKERQ